MLEFIRKALASLASQSAVSAELQALDEVTARLEKAAKFHEHQRDYFGRRNGDQQFIRIHDLQARVVRQDIVRNGHEKKMTQTGKTFWELHDINEWACRAPKSHRDSRWDSFWGELPSSAIAPLHQLIEQRRRDAHAREREAQRRWVHEDSDGLTAERLLNNGDTVTYRAVEKLVSQTRELLYRLGPDQIDSESLVRAAHETYKKVPTKPDVVEIILSAKRKMASQKPAF